MFETLEPRPDIAGSVSRYVGQVLAAPVVAGLISVPVFALYDRLTGPLPGAGAGLWDSAGLVLLFGIGFVVGRCAGLRWPGLCPTGLWVWVPPICVSVADFVGAWISPYERPQALSMFFRSTGAHEGLVRFVGTDPAFSLLGYSLGVYFAARVRRRRLAPHPRSPRT